MNAINPNIAKYRKHLKFHNTPNNFFNRIDVFVWTMKFSYFYLYVMGNFLHISVLFIPTIDKDPYTKDAGNCMS